MVECDFDCVNTVVQSKKRSFKKKRLTDNGFSKLITYDIDSIP